MIQEGVPRRALLELTAGPAEVTVPCRSNRDRSGVSVPRLRSIYGMDPWVGVRTYSDFEPWGVLDGLGPVLGLAPSLDSFRSWVLGHALSWTPFMVRTLLEI